MQPETGKIVAVFHKGMQFCENCRDSRYKVSGILIPQRILAYLGLIAYADHDNSFRRERTGFYQAFGFAALRMLKCSVENRNFGMVISDAMHITAPL